VNSGGELHVLEAIRKTNFGLLCCLWRLWNADDTDWAGLRGFFFT